MARRRRRRSGKGWWRPALGVLLLVFAIPALIALASLGYIVGALQTPIDEATLCPKSGPVAATILLIDATDSLNAVQSEALRQRLSRVRDETPKGALLAVYAVQPFGERLLEPVATLCNPGSAEDVSAWTSNPEQVEERWREEFDQPLADRVESLLTTSEAASSPIMEAVQAAVVRTFLDPRLEGRPRRIVIVSDLLQHSALASSYPGATAYPVVRAFAPFRATNAYRSVRSELRGVDVLVYYIRRNTGAQGRELIQFWADYFADQGATLSEVIALEG